MSRQTGISDYKGDRARNCWAIDRHESAQISKKKERQLPS